MLIIFYCSFTVQEDGGAFLHVDAPEDSIRT